MSLETFTGWIPALVQSNPTAVDPKSEGDDHLRGIKKTLSVSFSGFVDGESVEVTAKEINEVCAGGAPNRMPVGMVAPFGMKIPPAGWLECDGRPVDRTLHADLFAAIGTTFGVGNGSTTFNLPDLRGEFVRGWSHSRPGADDGRVFGTNQTGANAPHNHDATTGAGTPHAHTATGGAHTHTVTAAVVQGSGINGGGSFSSHSNQSITTSSSAHTHAISLEDAHTHTVDVRSSGIEARPRNVALMYCIKA